MSLLDELPGFKRIISEVTGQPVGRIYDGTTLSSLGISNCARFRELATRLNFPLEEYVTSEGILTEKGKEYLRRGSTALDSCAQENRRRGARKYFTEFSQIVRETLVTPQRIFDLSVFMAYNLHELIIRKEKVRAQMRQELE